MKSITLYGLMAVGALASATPTSLRSNETRQLKSTGAPTFFWVVNECKEQPLVAWSLEGKFPQEYLQHGGARAPKGHFSMWISFEDIHAYGAASLFEPNFASNPSERNWMDVSFIKGFNAGIKIEQIDRYGKTKVLVNANNPMNSPDAYELCDSHDSYSKVSNNKRKPPVLCTDAYASDTIKVTFSCDPHNETVQITRHFDWYENKDPQYFDIMVKPNPRLQPGFLPRDKRGVNCLCATHKSLGHSDFYIEASGSDCGDLKKAK